MPQSCKDCVHLRKDHVKIGLRFLDYDWFWCVYSPEWYHVDDPGNHFCHQLKVI